MVSSKKKKERRERRYTDAKQTMKEMDTFAPTAWNLPKGVQRFEFSEEKTYRIDIIPFLVGEGNPRADKGYDHYERSFWVHRNIGPNREAHCCLAKCFGKDCPICEHRSRLKQDGEGDDKLDAALKPQFRHLWLVYDYDEPDKGVQVLDTAHWKSFGEMLKDKIDASDEEDSYENFAHLEEGYTLKVSCKEDSFNGKSFIRPTNIEMKPRKEPLDPDITEDVPCLDELLVELSYKELKKKFEATPEPDDEDDEEEDDDKETKKSSKKDSEKSSGGSKKSKDDDDEDDDEDEDEKPSKSKKKEDDEDDDEVDFEVGDRVAGEYKKKPFKGTVSAVKNGLVTIKTDDGDKRVMDPDELEKLPKGKSKSKDDDDEEEDEDDEDEKPSKKKSKSKDEDDDEDDEDEDDEDEKPSQKKKKSKDEDDDEDDEEDDEDDEDEDESPKSKKSKSSKGSSKKASKDDDDEDDEEDDD